VLTFVFHFFLLEQALACLLLLREFRKEFSMKIRTSQIPQEISRVEEDKGAEVSKKTPLPNAKDAVETGSKTTTQRKDSTSTLPAPIKEPGQITGGIWVRGLTTARLTEPGINQENKTNREPLMRNEAAAAVAESDQKEADAESIDFHIPIGDLNGDRMAALTNLKPSSKAPRSELDVKKEELQNRFDQAKARNESKSDRAAKQQELQSSFDRNKDLAMQHPHLKDIRSSREEKKQEFQNALNQNKDLRKSPQSDQDLKKQEIQDSFDQNNGLRRPPQSELPESLDLGFMEVPLTGTGSNDNLANPRTFDLTDVKLANPSALKSDRQEKKEDLQNAFDQNKNLRRMDK
jgi:hypothetical protein